MTSPSQEEPDGLFALHTPVPGFGTIEAIRTGQGQRDYLLRDSKGTVTWLDQSAIAKILNPAPVPNEPSDSPTHAKHMQSGGELHVTEPSAIGDELDSLYRPEITDLEKNEYQGNDRPVIYLADAKRVIEQQTKLAHTKQHQYTAYNPYVDTFQYWCDCLNAIDKPKSTVIERPVRFILDDDGNVVFLEIKNLHGEASIKERSEG